jgi:hypothetical protein
MAKKILGKGWQPLHTLDRTAVLRSSLAGCAVLLSNAAGNTLQIPATQHGIQTREAIKKGMEEVAGALGDPDSLFALASRHAGRNLEDIIAAFTPWQCSKPESIVVGNEQTLTSWIENVCSKPNPTHRAFYVTSSPRGSKHISLVVVYGSHGSRCQPCSSLTRGRNCGLEIRVVALQPYTSTSLSEKAEELLFSPQREHCTAATFAKAAQAPGLWLVDPRRLKMDRKGWKGSELYEAVELLVRRALKTHGGYRMAQCAEGCPNIL